MIKNDAHSYPLQPAQSTYKLVGKASRDWYMFLITGVPAAPCLLLLSALPFAVWWTLSLSHWSHESILVSLLTLPVAHGAALCWFWTAKEHFRRVRSIEVYPDGLVLEAPKLKTRLKWHEVVDVFPAQSNEYVIWTDRGSFYFSKEMERSAQLCALIRDHLSERANYDFALVQREGYKQEIALADGAIVVALLFGICKNLILGKLHLQIDAVVTTVAGLLLTAFLYYFFVYKIPHCIRTGVDGILIQDGRGFHKLSWNSIKSVRKPLRLASPVISTTAGWFLIMWNAFTDRGERNFKQAMKEQNELEKFFFDSSIPRIPKSGF